MARWYGVLAMAETCVAFCGMAASDPDTGLVAHYAFDEGEGPLLHDRSGAANHGRIIGAQWVRGENGAALDFDGAREYVDCGDELNTRLRGPLTVSVWVCPFARDQQYVIARGDWNLCIRPDGVPALEVRGASDSPWHALEALPAASPVPLKEWTHIAAVYDTGSQCLSIFLNGALSNSKPKTDGSIGGIFRSKLVLGARYQGLIGEARLYKRALSREEINGIYQAASVDRSLASPEHRLGLRPHLFFVPRKIAAELYLREATVPERPVSIEVTLLRARERSEIRTQTIPVSPITRELEATFALPTPPAGEYELRACTKNAEGKPQARAACTVTVPRTPWWLKRKAQLQDRVFAPWTPLKVATRQATASAPDSSPPCVEIACWGRVYKFGSGLFPLQIVTAGKPILCEPIHLVGQADGREIDWRYAATRLGKSVPTEVRLKGRARASGLELTTDIRIEYDGLIRADLALRPVQTTRIESLALEIPLRCERASLVYQYRDQFSKGPGALPKGGIVRAFCPAIWLGDEESGLQWFTESDRNWHLAEPGRAVEIARLADKVVLRLNLVTAPLELSPGASERAQLTHRLTYTFGFQATPTKPVTKDAWDYRTFPTSGDPRPLLTEEINGKAMLDFLAEKRVRTLLLSAAWTEVQGYPACIGHAEELRRLVKACHRRGMQVIVYLGNIFTDTAPEYPAFLDDFTAWRRTSSRYPYDSYPCNTPPGRTYEAYNPCIGSEWQDLILAGTARLMDEFDLDGFYLDGFGLAGPCYNHHHACGYVRPDGSAGCTYPFFAGRNAIRRLYELVRSRKPDGQLDLHPGSAWFSPVMAWATNAWDGETILGDNRTPAERKEAYLKGQEYLLDYLRLDMFRAQYMGRPWGIPGEFLSYYVPDPYNRLFALTLLHDVLIRPNSLHGDLAFVSSLWRVGQAFERRRARWLPYWRNSQYVRVEPEGAYVSLYLHSRRGVLAVVSNLGREAAEVRASLNMKELGLSENSKAINALTGEPVSIHNGEVSFRLDSVDWRLLWVRP